MPLMRWGTSERIKDVSQERVAEYLSYGWVVCDDGVREPVEISAPVIPIVESPLDKLTRAVDAVVDAPEAIQKRKAGRSPKRR